MSQARSLSVDGVLDKTKGADLSSIFGEARLSDMIVYWCKARIYMIVVGIEKMEVACDESNRIMVLVEDFMQNIYLAALSGFRMAFSAAMAVEHHDNMVEGLEVDTGGH